MKPSSPVELARYLDHTVVRADATRSDVERCCAEARAQGFHGVCVNGGRVELAYSLLEDTSVKVTALVGFPLGASDADAKRYETEVAIDQGAQEIEVVVDIGRLKDGDNAFVLRELRDIAEAADERPVTAVLDASLLTREELTLACALALDSGVRAVGTSTCLGDAATVEAVRSLREAVGERFGVKAAGGIRDLPTAFALIEAGATRLGTSQSVALIQSMAAGISQP
jgi:deoxyribose-phosphate aldolase